MSNFDGGPAFPIVGDRGERLDNAAGMTLRDYFAAKAMLGFLAGCRARQMTDDNRDDGAWHAHEQAMRQQDEIERLMRTLERQIQDFWQSRDYKEMGLLN